MLDERKAAILRAVVEEYIETAQPVGSAHVVPPRACRSPRRRCATTWPRSSRRATCTSPTPAPAGCPPRRATASSSTTSGHRPASGGTDAEQVRTSSTRPTASSSRCCRTPSRLLVDLTDYAARRRRPARHEAAGPLGAARRARPPRPRWSCVVLSNGAVEKHTARAAPTTIGEERIGAATAHLPPTSGRSGAASAPLPATGDAVTDALCASAVALAPAASHGDDPTRSSSAAPPAWRAPSTPSRPCARCSASSSSSTSSSPCSATCSTGA